MSISSDEGAYPIQFLFRLNGEPVIVDEPLSGSSTIKFSLNWSTLLAQGVSATTPDTYDIDFIAADSYQNISQAVTTLTEVSPVPEPVSIWLMLIGLCVLDVISRSRTVRNLSTESC